MIGPSVPPEQAVIVLITAASQCIALTPGTFIAFLSLFQKVYMAEFAPPVHPLLQDLPAVLPFRVLQSKGPFHGLIHIQDFICLCI